MSGLKINIPEEQFEPTKLWIDLRVGGASNFSINSIGEIILDETASDKQITAAETVSGYIKQKLNGMKLI